MRNSMKKPIKQTPKFKNEEEEFDSWSSHDSSDLFSDSEEIHELLELTKLKRKKQRITMLLDPQLKIQLHKLAADKGIRYQTLIQMWLKERIRQEIKDKLVTLQG